MFPKEVEHILNILLYFYSLSCSHRNFQVLTSKKFWAFLAKRDPQSFIKLNQKPVILEVSMDKIPNYFKPGIVFKNAYIFMPEHLLVYQESDNQFCVCSQA